MEWESGLLSDRKLAEKARGFVFVKVPDGQRIAKEYGITTREFTGSGVVLLLSPDGRVLERLGGDTSLENLLQAMREADFKSGLLSYHFLHFYFSVDQPDMHPGEIKDLLKDLDDDLIEVREAATARAIRRRAPAHRALNSLKSSALSAETVARVKRILAALAPLAERMKRLDLDRDVEFLARLLEHPDGEVRRKAQARARRILPQIEAKSAVDLRERWRIEKDRLRWDARQGRYVSK